MISILFTLHLLSAVIWVGGMFFAYMVLRPTAAELLEPPERLKLWSIVFSRFFPWVWLAVIALPASGYLILFNQYQGFANVGVAIHIMQVLGLLMILIFAMVYFFPYKSLVKNLNQNMIPDAAKNLNRIRQLIAINLSLGLLIVVITGMSRF